MRLRIIIPAEAGIHCYDKFTEMRNTLCVVKQNLAIRFARIVKRLVIMDSCLRRNDKHGWICKNKKTAFKKLLSEL